MKNILFLLLLIIPIITIGQELNSKQEFTHNSGGNRTEILTDCLAPCNNNQIKNPNYKNGMDDWWTVEASIDTNTVSGIIMLSFCNIEAGGAGQNIPIQQGKEYTLSVFAKISDGGYGKVGLQFYDYNDQPMGTPTEEFVTTDEFRQYVIIEETPQGAKFAQIIFWKSLGACASVYGWCLTPNDGSVPLSPCENNLLTNYDFPNDDFEGWWKTDDCFVYKGIANTCTPNHGGAGQNIPITSGEESVFTLRVRAKISQNGFNAKIGMTFLDTLGNVIGNSYNQLIYETKFQEFKIIGKAPIDAHFVQVIFWKSNGTGCLITDDWCLTSSLNTSSLTSISLSFSAFRDDDVTDLFWANNSGKVNDYFVLERADEMNSFKPIKTINAQSDTEGFLTFTDTDFEPEPGINLYRIKLVLKNGNYIYSEVKKVIFPKDSEFFSLVPNPAMDKTTIYFSPKISSREGAEITLVDGLGREIYNYNLSHEDLQSPFSINVNDLKGGIYFIQVNPIGQRKITKQLVVVKD